MVFHFLSGIAALKEVLEHCLVEAGAKAKAELATLATTTAEKDFMVIQLLF
jgi:hypothetical protein